MNKTLKLGTRRSMLAMAQSGAVAGLIENANPGLRVELVGIETQGDRVLDVPLSKIEGKEFFVAELDTALLNGEVDLTVHSMKDLSLERPPEIHLAAIPERENPRDIILFAPDFSERLKAGQPLRIGTSSPRRIENVLPFLRKALPAAGVEPQLEACEIRGNVNTRISLLHLGEDEPKRVDAVVLAFAGLKRLWADETGRRELRTLLKGSRWMVLPLDECPTAPAQGALAIECRAADKHTRAALASIHSEATAAEVRLERQVLADWGGGCHQRFGATAVSYPELGTLLYIKGAKPDDTPVFELRWEPIATESPVSQTWDGTGWRDESFTTEYAAAQDAPEWVSQPGALFVAHSRALPDNWASILAASSQRVWTSGTASWFSLAAHGIWVEGCAEGIGYEWVRPLLSEPLLGLPAAEDWRILSHSDAADTWPEGSVTATYKVKPNSDLQPGLPVVKELAEAQAIFWSSASQYAAMRDWVPDGCQHACRYGKTLLALREQGLSPLTAYPNAAKWRELHQIK